MNRFVGFIFIYLLNLNYLIESGFNDEDFRIVKNLNGFINSNLFIFVDDGKDFRLVENVKEFSGVFFCSVLSVRCLDNILSDDSVQLNFFQKKTVIVLKDLDEVELSRLLEKVLVPHLLTWVLFKNFNKYGENLYIPIHFDVLFVYKTQNITKVDKVYYVKPGTGKTVKTIWEWVNGEVEESKSSVAVDHKKENFQNVTMVMHVLLDKNSCKNFHGKDIVSKLECLHQNMLYLIGKRLNFSIRAVEVVDKENPYIYPNGTDSELFFALKNRQVDFSVASHIIRKRRIGFYDFIWPTFVLKSTMFLKVNRVAGNWTSYLRPLDSSIWWGILILIIVSGTTFLIFKIVLSDRKCKVSVIIVYEFVYSVLTTLQIFCNQGVMDLPPFISFRILHFVMLFVALVFFQAYAGYLVSSLMVVVPYFPFTDMKGFFDNKLYQIMTVLGGFHRFFISKVVGEGKKEDFMLQEGLPKNVQEAINKLCTNRYLVFTEFKEELLDIDKLKCKIQELPFPVAYIHLTMVLPRNSPYREIVNRERLFLESTGIMQRMRTHVTYHKEFYNKNSEEEYVTVSMSEVFSIIILLGVGITLSLIILSVEIFLKKKQRTRRDGLYIARPAN